MDATKIAIARDIGRSTVSGQYARWNEVTHCWDQLPQAEWIGTLDALNAINETNAGILLEITKLRAGMIEAGYCTADPLI